MMTAFEALPKNSPAKENRKKRCLIVVDYQNDFVSGSLGFAGAETLEQGILREIEKTRSDGGDVLFTLDTHAENYLQTGEGKKLPVAHCLVNTPGHALYGRVAQAVQPEDILINKPTFGSAELFRLLAERAYDTVTLVGLVSHICVLSNAVLAKTACPEADVRVIADLTAAADAALHQAALDVMRSLQIEIL